MSVIKFQKETGLKLVKTIETVEAVVSRTY